MQKVMIGKLNGYIFWLKMMTIWDKASADVKKQFDSEPIYNEKTFGKQK